MICPICQIENYDYANYCKSCGHELKQNAEVQSKDFASAKLVFLSVMLQILFTISEVIFFRYIKPWERWAWDITMVTRVQLVFNILSFISLILLPLSIKNSTLKIVGIFLTVVLYIYFIGTNIYEIFASS